MVNERGILVYPIRRYTSGNTLSIISDQPLLGGGRRGERTEGDLGELVKCVSILAGSTGPPWTTSMRLRAR